MEPTEANQSDAKPRPKLFRALGAQNPPVEIQIDGRTLNLERTIKHDSWAATSVYRNGSFCVVCKFNRVEPILFFPCQWLGRWLARRESAMYYRLADVPQIATGYPVIYSKGVHLKHATAHEFVEGHPLSWHDRVSDDFFEQLKNTLYELHRRDIAYVDLNKWENIIIDSTGKPWLIDFQISVKLQRKWPFSGLLNMLQESDLYHLSKHASRIRPDLYSETQFGPRPWWIRFHRRIANPIRAARRRLLVLAGIRRGKGKPQSELFIEEGLRETGNRSSSIVELYKILRSESYIDCASAGGSDYLDTAYFDLFGSSPVHHLEAEMVTRLKSETPHDQVVWLLKSPTFIANTKRWDDRLIRRKIRQIQAKLQKHQQTQIAAA